MIQIWNSLNDIQTRRYKYGTITESCKTTVREVCSNCGRWYIGEKDSSGILEAWSFSESCILGNEIFKRKNELKKIYPSCLTHFVTLASFYNPWKHQTTIGFLIISEGIESDQWHEMGYIIHIQKHLIVGVIKNCCSAKLWKVLESLKEGLQ